MLHKGSIRESIPRGLGIVGAYDGHRVGVGRVGVDSTWHHWFDINLIGDPIAPPPKNLGFNASDEGRAHLQNIKAYYRNVATWLARDTTHRNILMGGVGWLQTTYPLNEVLHRNAPSAGPLV